jgi:crotonobetainyl-CoA:carnitine CoA-transferase CaiB-like acyl-CoA transferase
VNLLSSVLSALVNQASGYVAAGVVPRRMGNRHPSIAPYEVYAVRDGELVLAVGNDRQFAALCEVLGVGLAGDPRFATNPARVVNRADMNAVLEPVLRTRDGIEWFEVLTAAGVPCGPINDLAGAFALADRLGLEPVVDAAGSPQVANPIRLSATPPTYRLRPPALPG